MEFIDLKEQYRALQPSIDARMKKVLDHGQYIMGPEVAELELKLAAYTGSRHCITCSSGTEALLMSMMALGIGPGDEVITTPFTFAATAEMIVLLGAKPVFVDIELDTCNIDANLIEAKITPRTRAIMPVSLYGQVADMDEINAIAARHGNIPVIEDAAQSFGADYKGRKSCNLSTFGCTSFFPSKPLGCYGDGGAIFTNDDVLAKACREIRVHGQSERYVHTRVGLGGRMDTLQCAIVLAKLEQFEWEVGKRVEIGALYNATLKKLGISAVSQKADRNSVFAQYTVMVDDRDMVQGRLKEAGIPTAVHYPIPLNLQPAYAQLCCPDCTPKASQVARKVMSLPMHPYLDESTLARITSALASAVALVSRSSLLSERARSSSRRRPCPES
ncbi:MAG: DegT/DnrJ/EryC1/StrS family aminotransferase [Pseudomonadota bacterium]|nr:DegT/DnrJ/EryC1/StrS family aminotransferase [Pseudomonadota bacterium]